MKAYFSRLTPFYLLSEEEAGDSAGFDSYPVEVTPDLLTLCENLRSVTVDMTAKFDDMPAPEERTQEEADYLSDLLKAVFRG